MKITAFKCDVCGQISEYNSGITIDVSGNDITVTLRSKWEYIHKYVCCPSCAIEAVRQHLNGQDAFATESDAQSMDDVRLVLAGVQPS